MTVVERFYELVDRGRSGENSSLSIGLPRMEEYIEGLSQGTSYLLGAGSGTGKTTLLLYSFIYKPIMEDDPEKDVHFIYFNLEMDETQILAKLLSIYIYETYGEIIPFKEIFSRGHNTTLSDDKYELIQQCKPILEKFEERIIFHSGSLNADTYDKTIIEDLKNFGTFVDGKFYPKNSKQIIGIVVDHLNLVRASNGRTKKEEIDIISNHSVTFRNGCKIVSPINIMQLNRNSYGQERIKQGLQEPDESDFKDSGTVLEDAMVALLMYSPVKAKLSTHRGYNIKELGANYRSLKCIKNRFGTADVAVGLGFYGEVGVFKELPPAAEINDYEIYKHPSWSLIPYKDEPKQEDTSNTKLTIVL